MQRKPIFHFQQNSDRVLLKTVSGRNTFIANLIFILDETEISTVLGTTKVLTKKEELERNK